MKKITQLILAGILFTAACTSPEQKEQIAQKPVITADTSSENSITNSTTIMEELGKRYGAEKQRFVINNLKDTLIRGKQGTYIFLPKGCFVPSNTKMNLVLKEVYELKGFIYNNLTTETTDGGILSSNGMIYLDVESDTKVTINSKKPVKIKFPSTDKKSSDLFLAVKDANGTIKWEATGNNTLPTTKSLMPQRKKQEVKIASDTTYFYEGSLLDLGNAFCYKGYDTIRTELEYPFSLRARNISGPVYIDLTINDVGQLEEVKLKQGLNKEIDEMIINAVKRKKEWVPGFVQGRPEKSIIRYKFQVNGKSKDYSIELPREVYHMSELDISRYNYWLSIKKTYTEPKIKQYEDKKRFADNLDAGSDEIVKIDKGQNVKGYIYPLLNLGRWINCDRLIAPGGYMQAQLIVKPSIYTNMTLIAIFSDLNRSALYFPFDGELFKSPLIRKDSRVTLVGIANSSDNSPMLFIKRLNGITKDTLDGQLKKVTYKELKQEIDNIKG